MNQIVSATSHDLLTCFFQESEKQFRFLEEKHGYMYLSGLAEYQKNYKVIKPYKNDQRDNTKPFFAVTRYERHTHAIEILYGDKQYVLEVYVYPDAFSRLSLHEIVAATRGDYPAMKNLSHLMETQKIAESLQLFSQAMQENPKIIQPSERLIKRASTIQGKLMEQGVREHLKKLVQNASILSAEAFTHKDYTRVIEILEPLEDYLSSSDHKKLTIARKKT